MALLEWEAAFIVVFEDNPPDWNDGHGSWVYYRSVPRLIERRSLYTIRAREPHQNVGRLLRDFASEYVERRPGKQGDYRIRNYAQAAEKYNQLRQRYPWHFENVTFPGRPAPSIPAIPTPDSASGRPAVSKSGVMPTAPVESPPVPPSEDNGQTTAKRRTSPSKRRPATVEPAPAIIAEEVCDPETYIEGAVHTITVNSYERSSEARLKCIRHKGLKCVACKFEFEAFYGDIGRGYIHVHHLNPIAAKKKGYRINWKRDLVPVCPNCHAMLHKEDPPVSVKELRRRILRARRKARSRRSMRVKQRSAR